MGKTALTSARYTRAERLDQIRWRRQRGMTYREIADDLGLSLRGVYVVAYDPDGSKDRARKNTYGRKCERCGATTTGCNGREKAPDLCRTCTNKQRYDEREWTRDRIIAAFQKFAVFAGRAPGVLDSAFGFTPSQRAKVSAARVAEAEAARAAGLVVPHPVLVRREFGSWRAAVEASGLTPMPSGAPAHRRHASRREAA